MAWRAVRREDGRRHLPGKALHVRSRWLRTGGLKSPVAATQKGRGPERGYPGLWQTPEQLPRAARQMLRWTIGPGLRAPLIWNKPA